MSLDTLVLLHAFGASARAWDGVVAQLGGRFEIVALDLPGFGGAPDDLHAQSVDDYAAWTMDQIAERGLTRYALVGWSMGGKIAVACALRQPQGLEALILVAPSPPGPEPMSADARQTEREAFDDPQAAGTALHEVAGDDVGDAPLHQAVADRLATDRSARDFWLDVGSKEDLSEAARRLTLPILLITGDQDEHLGPDAAEDHVTPKLPHATHRVIAGSGHLIPYEAPQALAEDIAAWYVAGMGAVEPGEGLGLRPS
jgi:pimeloyl-ACP methyl ester carboxylesterase